MKTDPQQQQQKQQQKLQQQTATAAAAALTATAAAMMRKCQLQQMRAVEMIVHTPGSCDRKLTPAICETVAKLAASAAKLRAREQGDAAGACCYEQLCAVQLQPLANSVQGEARRRMIVEILEAITNCPSGLCCCGAATGSGLALAFADADSDSDTGPVGDDDGSGVSTCAAVLDLALLIMYASFLTARQSEGCDPFREVAPAMIRGYTAEMPLSDGQLQRLPLLVAGRFAQALILRALACELRAAGDDSSFLQLTACCWSTLDRLWNAHKHQLVKLGQAWLLMAAAGGNEN